MSSELSSGDILMPRRSPQIEVELGLLLEGGTAASASWKRATEILLRAKARREARLAADVQQCSSENAQTASSDRKTA